ncbi:MAG: hypothetical protein HRU20_28160 [Pseudomonadales bacterium]|nr:hypothetical protein [Pseudomonadales bacterium]
MTNTLMRYLALSAACMPSMVFSGCSNLEETEGHLGSETYTSKAEHAVLKKWQAFQQDVETLVEGGDKEVSCSNIGGKIVKEVFMSRIRISYINCLYEYYDEATGMKAALIATGSVSTWEGGAVSGHLSIEDSASNWTAAIYEVTTINDKGIREGGAYSVGCIGTVDDDHVCKKDTNLASDASTLFKAPYWCELGANCSAHLRGDDHKERL